MAASSTFRLFLAAVLGVIVFSGLAWGEDASANRDEIIHVLNRVTFGPRPGDVEMVQKMGLNNYIEQQLHPEAVDDSACDQEIAKFALLQMTPQQLADIASHKNLKGGNKNKAAPVDATMQDTASAQPAAMQETAMKSEAQSDVADPASMQASTQDATQAKAGPTKAEKEAEMPWRSDAAIGQLEHAKIVRAIDSQRQLQEVLVDFWNNHFNIDVKKNGCTVTKIADDRDVIRAHIWGKFHDLLEASAKSPAMLYYLDNATSVADQEAPGGDQAARNEDRGGLNENYGREIMELHTLGVDAGYTQKDVQEVARCFTGWSADRRTGEFVFHADQHDNKEKIVLGHVIPANGGMQDGETVLDILCAQPACAHHIAFQLCQRFVADVPPPALVDRIAGVFTKTGGDLREVTKAILASPEFLSPASYGNKIKSPFEFAVSAVRATESTIVAQQPSPMDKMIPTREGRAILGKSEKAVDRMETNGTQSLNWRLVELGEPLFACTPPTGYKEASSIWFSPGGFIDRLNFAMALTGQELSDVTFDPQKVLGGIDPAQPKAVVNQCVAALLQNKVSASTRKVLEKAAVAPGEQGKTADPAELIALIIGSPEFQKK